VIFSPALKALEAWEPGHGVYHGHGKAELMAPALLDLCACVDHVLPVARGGTNHLENLVCACWKCNTAKNDFEPERWLRGLRKESEPVCTPSWDGLVSMLKKLEPENEWLRYFVIK